MQIRCPHCHNPIEVVDKAISLEITCPSCGSGFSLVDRPSTNLTTEFTERTIAHFELYREIGVGQYGSVWVARDTKLGREVAVKIPRTCFTTY